MRGNVAASDRPAMNSYGDWFKQHRAYGEPLDEARYPHPRQGRVPYFYLLENETACEGEGRSGDCATYGCDAFGCGEAVGGVHLACRMDASAAAALRKLGLSGVNVTRRCQQEELSLKRESVGTPSTLRRQNWNKGD